MTAEARALTIGLVRSTTEPLTRHLAERGIAYELVEHGEAFTSVDEARAAGVDPRHAAKSVLLREHHEYRLAVIPAARQLDLARMRTLVAASRHLRLATEDEMAHDFPQFEVGAIPPVGPGLPPTAVVNIRLLYSDRIACASGDHRHLLLLDPRDLVRAAEPIVADVCEHADGGRFHELPRV
jgi:Ala-tRNA(Pro) deacylase